MHNVDLFVDICAQSLMLILNLPEMFTILVIPSLELSLDILFVDPFELDLTVSVSLHFYVDHLALQQRSVVI